jgi:predicted O-methyltransferase YrrM
MKTTSASRTPYHKLQSAATHAIRSLSLLPSLIRFRRTHPGDAWHIHTHLTKCERLMLYKLGLNQPSKAVMVEIGSYLGASSCFLAAAALEIQGARLHCVDTWENEGMSEGSKDTWQDFRYNTRDYQHVIEPHRGRSLNIAKAFSHRIDLIFIDGDHSYEGCHGDIANWLPLVKAGGCVVLHDLGWAEGVQKVVSEDLRPLAKKEGRLPNLYWAWL